jgi:hypothetical protein
MCKYILFFLLIFLIGCSNSKLPDYILNDKNIALVYEIKKSAQSIDYERDVEPNINKFKSLNEDNVTIPDSLIEINPQKIVSIDTLYLIDTKKLGGDSLLYIYNSNIFPYWSNQTLSYENQLKYINENGDIVFLKEPIKISNKWENNFIVGKEYCTITKIDTTLSLADLNLKCIEIKIELVDEDGTTKSKIFKYFNKKYGLVKYMNYDKNDELTLLKVINKNH